jgi:ABC-type sugar transport system substrate-binding protein
MQINKPTRRNTKMTITKTRRALTALVAALSVAGAATATAGAAAAHSPTPDKLTIHYSGDGFYGQIKSAKATCLTNRTVAVHKASGRVVYTDTTETDGSWDTGNSGPVHGKFYATVNAKGGCLPLVSKTILTG